MKTTLAALFLTVSLFPLNLYAQSGRKTTEPKPAKGQSSKPAETSDGITTDRIASPDGETIEGDVIRFDTALITVPVTVQDRYGRYVPLLRRENFRIMEDGVEQKIAYFATTDSPFTVVLLLDTSGSTRLRLDDIQNAAINFVGKLKAADSVMVMSFDDRINVLCNATTDRDAITKAIRKTRTGGGTRLYDAVEDVLTKQLKTISGRKAVVLFTDGVDTASRRATYNSTMRLAEESEAAIWWGNADARRSRNYLRLAVPTHWHSGQHRRRNARRLQTSSCIPESALRQDRRTLLRWRLDVRDRAGVYVDRRGTRAAVQYWVLPFETRSEWRKARNKSKSDRSRFSGEGSR
jgi:Mg-chelatase subunit ChlD